MNALSTNIYYIYDESIHARLHFMFSPRKVLKAQVENFAMVYFFDIFFILLDLYLIFLKKPINIFCKNFKYFI
jgi:hypothetical protein